MTTFWKGSFPGEKQALHFARQERCLERGQELHKFRDIVVIESPLRFLALLPWVVSEVYNFFIELFVIVFTLFL